MESRFQTQPLRFFSITTKPTNLQFEQNLGSMGARLAAESPIISDFVDLHSNESFSIEVETKKKPLPKLKWMKEAIQGGEKYV
ncbi:unnamed protein product [Linum trigynum]|uniref:Uncharacterized protein n=1 Tax=Linum trigynum TaxID=586398 RepID=A0AAV2E7M5_9ROSI